MYHRRFRRGSRFLILIALLCSSFTVARAGDEAPDMEAWMAAATPGPHHAAMAARAGTWKVTSKMWMAPGQDPMTSEGTAVLEAVLDGRFLEEVIQAPMMGMPWEGRGVYGYDNTSGKHIGTWYDSWGTMMMTFEGTCEEHCSKIAMTGKFFDPSTKTTKTMKSVTTQKNDNEAMVTLYDVVDGKDVKTGEVTYVRVAAKH